MVNWNKREKHIGHKTVKYIVVFHMPNLIDVGVGLAYNRMETSQTRRSQKFSANPFLTFAVLSVVPGSPYLA